MPGIPWRERHHFGGSLSRGTWVRGTKLSSGPRDGGDPVHIPSAWASAVFGVRIQAPEGRKSGRSVDSRRLAHRLLQGG